MDTPYHQMQSFNLPPDVKREIQKKVLEDKTHEKNALVFPDEGRHCFTTDLKPANIKSNTWNKLGAANRQYLWDQVTWQIALYKPGIKYDQDEIMFTLSTAALTPASVQTDGPNTTQDVLVAGNASNASRGTIRYYLKQITASHNKTVEHADWHIIPGQTLVTIALSPSRSFTILGQNYSRSQILSWYKYDTNRSVALANRSILPSLLTQIAFITPNVLLGLISSKQLITLWLDHDRNILKFQLHKTPFAVERFAIDSQNPDFIAFTYYETKNEQVWDSFHDLLPSMTMVSKRYFCLAVSSLKNRDKDGKCLYKSKIITEIPPTYAHSLEFMNGVIMVNHGHRANYWKIPAALFSTFFAKKN